MPQDVYQHTYANGLTLLLERMEHVRSATINFLIPSGCAYDPTKQRGLASVLSEMITRGAGERDSRALALALDNLGVDRDESVGIMHMRFWGGTLARNLPKALDLYADILLRPHLPEQELDPVRDLAIQDIESLEDEPRQQMMIELRRIHYPAPLNYDRRGTRAGLEAITSASLRRHYKKHFSPHGSIISVAGNIEWDPLCEQVNRLFGDWKVPPPPPLKLGKVGKNRSHILQEGKAQTQIGIAYPSVPVGHEDYYAAIGAVNVLSGGMSARLFTEVREKRGLCYAVSASYAGFKDRGSVIGYAGTTNERAQETLDVTLAELKRLSEGIEPEEVERVRAGLKSSLIMQEESTSARAGMLASDWYYLGRVRSFEEIKAAIDGLTPSGIVDHLRRYPPGDFTIVTLGPTALDVQTASAPG